MELIIKLKVHEVASVCRDGSLAAFVKALKAVEAAAADDIDSAIEELKEAKAETKAETKEDKKEVKTEEVKKEVKKAAKTETEADTDVTIEDIRALFVEKNKVKGNAPKLKAVLTDLGVTCVTDLADKPELYPEVVERLEEV